MLSMHQCSFSHTFFPIHFPLQSALAIAGWCKASHRLRFSSIHYRFSVIFISHTQPQTLELDMPVPLLSSSITIFFITFIINIIFFLCRNGTLSFESVFFCLLFSSASVDGGVRKWEGSATMPDFSLDRFRMGWLCDSNEAFSFLFCWCWPKQHHLANDRINIITIRWWFACHVKWVVIHISPLHGSPM